MELPPSSWVPSVLKAGGINGLLVFGFVFGIMGTLRLLAGPVVRVLTPTGILFTGAILATLGLYLFSMAETTLMAFLTAAIWAAGIAYFWPTMLGYVSERNPKSGALGLGVMGAVGMLASFFVTPWLGGVADDKGHDVLKSEVVVEIFEEVTTTFPAIAQNAGSQSDDIMGVHATAQDVLSQYSQSGDLPRGATMQALRAVSGSGIDTDVVSHAQEQLNPADNEGGRLSFRTLAPFGFILIVVFGILLIRDIRAGGYRAEKIESE